MQEKTLKIFYYLPLIFENKLQTKYQNNFTQNRLSKPFRLFKNPSRFRFPWTRKLVGQEKFRTRNSRKDSGKIRRICSSDDKTRAGRRSSLAARYTLEVNQLIGGNFRGKSGNLTLSCVCSAESRRRETLPSSTANGGNKNTFGLSEGREK